jgi:mono/diheme cytochrome c family protein
VPTLEAHGFLKTHVFTPPGLRTVHDGNRAQAGHFLALTTCSNCHSLSNTGMRPLTQYFGLDPQAPGAIQEMATYLQASVSTGNTLYMPLIPLNDEEALALATYIATLKGQAPATTLVQAQTAPALTQE